MLSKKLIMEAYDQVGILRGWICDEPLEVLMENIALVEVLMKQHFKTIVKLKDTVE